MLDELVIYFLQGHPNLRSQKSPIIGYITQNEDVIPGPQEVVMLSIPTMNCEFDDFEPQPDIAYAFGGPPAQ